MELVAGVHVAASMLSGQLEMQVQNKLGSISQEHCTAQPAADLAWVQKTASCLGQQHKNCV